MPLVKKQTGRYRDKIVIFHKDPLVELLASLHVFANSEHHPQWVKIIKKARIVMGKEFCDRLDDFAQSYYELLFVMDIGTKLARKENSTGDIISVSFDDCLKKYDEMPLEEFAYYFLGLGALNVDKIALEAWIDKPESGNDSQFKVLLPFIELKKIKMFLGDVEGYKRLLREIIVEYWEVEFYKIWNQICIYNEMNIRSQKELYAEKGFEKYMSIEFPEILYEENQLIVRKDVDYRIDIDKISLVHVFSSTFTAPHFMIDMDETELVLYNNITIENNALQIIVPQNIIEFPRAVSDETRVKILRVLSNAEASTGELAEMLQLAASTVSAHLKILKSANLVTTRQDKKFVYYRTDLRVLEEALHEMIEYYI